MLPWFQSGGFPLYLAPMAGFTDVVYRELCKRMGADVLVSEFVLAESLLHDRFEAWEAVDFSPSQRPMGVQLFGSSPEIMARAARAVVDRLAPDFIDLNFGCPSDKVVCRDAGSSLLRDLPRLEAVASTVRAALPDCPVTGKIRIGWDDESIVAVEAAQALQRAGLEAIAVHGRTKVQGYSGQARWDVIGAVADAVDIPVIGNGDIRSSSDVARVRATNNVRGLMIGRAALGYPWLFREIKEHLATGALPPPPALEERWATIRQYAGLLAARPGRLRHGKRVVWMRPKLIKLTKGMTGCKRARGLLKDMCTLDDLNHIAAQHLADYTAMDADRRGEWDSPQLRGHRRPGEPVEAGP